MIGGEGLSKRLALLVLAAGLAAGQVAGAAERKTPSGLPVPRYVSVGAERANAHTNPGIDEPVKGVYRARGLPLQVVAETKDWRRVCDPDGALSWIRRSNLDRARTVINVTPKPVAVLRRPRGDARVVAYLGPRAIAAFERCDQGWCRVRLGRASGWVRQGALWGASDEPQCGLAHRP